MTWRRLTGFVLAIVASSIASNAKAGVEFSSDIGFSSSGLDLRDHDVAEITSGTLTLVTDLPPLPAAVELTSFLRDGGDVLFTIDTTALVEGVTLESRDVARWDGATLSIEVDGSAIGIPNGIEIDALTALPATGNLLISVDSSATVGALNVDDEDLFRVFPSPLMIFDGSSEGIDRALDLDGAAITDDGLGLLSFDGGGVVDGIEFRDEDVLSWDPTTGAFAMHFDGSAQGPEFEAIDVTAVPEPTSSLGLLSGAGTLAWLSRRRRADGLLADR